MACTRALKYYYNMKTINGTTADTRSGYFEYEVNGASFWVQGELAYNESKKQFEHEHIGVRGGRYLIYWRYDVRAI
jgi:hypothetical protein